MTAATEVLAPPMPPLPAPPLAMAPTPAPTAAASQDLLVEDVSIDGMCGVY